MSSENKTSTAGALVASLGCLLTLGCSDEPEGIARAQQADTVVKMDFFHRPLPEIALPNDIATRYDPNSATLRRINASMIAPTGFEVRVRELIDQLDGWGQIQPITIPFTGPIDVMSIVDRHRDDDYDTSDDALYLVNIDPNSAKYGELYHLDIGNGNYPFTLERRSNYWKNDLRADTGTLVFEEVNEDKNGNGRLDPGEDRNGNGQLDPGEDLDGDGQLDPPEDSDADGILDLPNFYPGANPDLSDPAQRIDATMTFYEKSTNTLIARPMIPLDERTTYAVVVTRRILDESGNPVGSPYPYVNHNAQTEALEHLKDVMPAGLGMDDIAFTYSFTTGTLQSEWVALRDGLYGHGAQRHLAEDFPTKVDKLWELRDEPMWPDSKQRHLLYGEQWKPLLELIATQLQGQSEGSREFDYIKESVDYIDFIAMGTFKSPQLFKRFDETGEFLPLHDQVWPIDLDLLPAEAQGEDVHFTLVVPRKESSVRGEGKQAPLVVVGHGYGSNRFEGLQFGGYLARAGLATISIDGPSHGLGLSETEQSLATALASGSGVGTGVTAFLTDRAWDQNRDGIKDSGADFWTAYLFHTRDIVRQFAVDYMQLVRLIRSFDGQRNWEHDVDGDGATDLAGDFDGDGQLEIGSESDLYFVGGSLGGIMSMIMGAIEPEVTASAPISGGAGLADVGIRSQQGGVTEAFILRGMGPLFVGSLTEEGDTLIETIVPDLNGLGTYPVATLKGVMPWDTIVVENLANGELACGFFDDAGNARVGIEADRDDPVRVLIYAGSQLIAGSEHCDLYEGAQLRAEIGTFESAITHQGEEHEAGSALVALEDGLGFKRGHPDFRRFQGLGQLVIERCDPINVARHLGMEPLYYPGTGQTTGGHMMVITTMGDMNVPASSGVTYARAAGLIDYLNADPRYGKPVNQELIDNYTAEAVHNLGRYLTPDGESVHLDIENFSEGTDRYGERIPRLEKPMRIGMDQKDFLGGTSAAIFPYTLPDGQHGFEFPNQQVDKAIRDCREACTDMSEGDPCGCEDIEVFDVGHFMFNMIGRYFISQGQTMSTDLCQSRNDCSDLPDKPEPRDPDTLK